MILSGLKLTAAADVVPPASGKFADEIGEAQVARLFQQVPVNFLANIACVAAMLGVYHAMVPPVWLAAWALYAQAVNGAGFALTRVYRHHKERRTHLSWARWFTAYGAADAATWGIAGWLFFAPDSPIHTLFLSAVLLGTVAGGQTAFFSYVPVMVVFNLGITVPIAIRFLVEGEVIYLAMSGLSLMYGFTMLRLGMRFHCNLINSWALRFELQENERALRESRDLLEERVRERTRQLQTTNEELTRGEAQYRAVVELQTELVCRFVPGGRLTFVNDAFCRFFATARERLIGGDFLITSRGLRILGDEEAAEILRCVANLSPSRSTGRCETPVGGKSGRRWLLWTHQALFDDAGRVIEYQSVAVDISERKRAERRVEYLAHHDALTALPNRLLLRTHMTEALQASGRSGTRCALVLLDLDDFKHVNDALGHLHGDELLKVVAKRLLACVRTGDLVARLGGDEFAIVQSRLASADEPAALAERLLDRLGRPLTIEGYTLRVGSSIGISVYPDDADAADQLLKNADLALYRAKSNGRGTYEFFSTELANQASRRMKLITGLREALEDDRLRLVYQPKFRLKDDRLIGCEALLRWTDPVDGPVSPSEFIPIAETSGLSLAIGDWVLDEVCRQLGEWLRQGKVVVPVSVNLSATQFSDRRLLEKTRETLTRHAIDPALVDFEITETALMHDLDLTTEMSKGLIDLGMRLAIDDFGTGYSSFGYLRRLPVAEIKIDRGFVADIADNENDRAILRAMVELGHSLGLHVLAEGVETPAQHHALLATGCDYAQGFLLGTPVGACELAGRLASVAGVEPAHDG
jgi:diguanylate cyclase (GGDEF)-like protein/PAS domain S-box-containing protein